MPKFSQESFTKLSQCHIDLQVLFYEVIKFFDCTILEGQRNQIEQNKAFSEGKSRLMWPSSKHNMNPSHAVDCLPYPINFNNTKRNIYFAGFVMAIAQKLKDEGKITHSIRWGGDWDSDNNPSNESFFDAGHFEIVI